MPLLLRQAGPRPPRRARRSTSRSSGASAAQRSPPGQGRPPNSRLQGLRRIAWPGRLRAMSSTVSIRSDPPGRRGTAPAPFSFRSRSRSAYKVRLPAPGCSRPTLMAAVIPEKPPDLPGDLGNGIGGKAGAVGKIKPPDRFQKPKASQLVQIVRLHSPAVIPADHAPDQAVVFQHRLLTGVPVPLLSRPQQLHGAIHRLIRGAIFFFITTVVPRPATDRTFKLSIKLSMMVKPMPLRSSPPVVNMGCRAFSTSGMPRP